MVGGVGLKHNVGLERSERLLHVFSKLVKGLDVLFLLVLLTYSPVSWFELLNEGLVDVVDDGVESSDCLVTDLSEEHLVVVLSRTVDRLARRGASHEVDTLATEFILFTVREHELWFVVPFHVLNLTVFVDDARYLVVHEQMCWATALHPRVEDGLVLVRE